MPRIEAFVDQKSGNLIFAAHTDSGSQAFAVTQQCDPRLFDKIARDFNLLMQSVGYTGNVPATPASTQGAPQ